MKTIFNGIFKENPILVLSIGLCPALAITTKVENAYTLGICFLVIIFISSLIISLMNKIFKKRMKMPVCILIIGIIVNIVEVLLSKYIPELYSIFGIYLSLIVISCFTLENIILDKNSKKIGIDILNSIAMGLGFTIVLTVIALVRETIGTNTITLMDNISSLTGYREVITNILPTNSIFPISIFATSSGAFLTLAFLIALFNKIKGGKKNESN